jgi:hypothetical protein
LIPLQTRRKIVISPTETVNSGSAESSVAAPPAIYNIADEEEDGDDEE